MGKTILAIHGGAGTILKSLMTDEKENAYKSALRNSLKTGFALLEKGASALDAVQAAVTSLEDNPLFNAGKGSVFTHDGLHEMDASIMDGNTLKAGAVAGVRNIRNPILLARTVMDHSDFVMLSGKGANDFATLMNVPTEKEDYFFNQSRYDQLIEAKKNDSVQLDHSDKKFGTVGAVALDVHGNLAAATSTGGMTNKHFNRIGDSPIIGSGTYANNISCAVSCTGHGEYFIRAVVAYDISCLMEYKGFSLAEACDLVVNKKLKSLGGEGGLIAIDFRGNFALPFNSEGMYRGMISQDDEFIGIYK
jgi:beta-aspartyl-peptidase (threonine type)